ncbi:mannosyl-oligosaccharide alpha-1,2-mannosidase [Scheffersomyces spartinae]|uniref:alpha-1,2-Mannosidase n=1 Tax=Scheffersomyces spartinae TaxID=45513 RepID=A0A9P7VD34_9ASCO|nr:mannosyl-oligosaccharide alpha-1,2-mannosidase [Scheffersomyces spartinae]KAG7195741.1 mannosyl-oligosaccharide alpha-1,2-mannosidase [Scheffersomyces spartinae]
MIGAVRKWIAKKTDSGSSLLPLYKDKPNGPHRSNINTHRSTLLKMLFKGFVCSIALYVIFYWYTTRNDTQFKFKGPGEFDGKDWSKAQTEVKDVMLESWHYYEKYGWGSDEFHPIGEKGRTMGKKPMGWIIVDSIDTLMLMDAKEEVARARTWIKDELDYKFHIEVNVFETTIRMLGGLLAAFSLSNDDLYLDKAVQLGNGLLGGFHSPTGLAYSSVNLLTGEGLRNHVDNGASSTAEVSTLQLEFKYLSKLTGETTFWEHVEKAMAVLDAQNPVDGLVPVYVRPDNGKFQGNYIRLGSRGDSYYEYLLKQYLQTNNQEKAYWEMYRESVAGVKKRLVKKSTPNGLTFIGELPNGLNGQFSNKMDHLVCFYGGLLALGATNGMPLEEARKSDFWNEELEDDFNLGQELTYTCYKMYHDVVPTGLSPEIVVFNTDGQSKDDFYIKTLDKHNLQRPETVESLFILYRLTGDVKYRKMGYEIFRNFVKYTRYVNKNGDATYTCLLDVTSKNGLKDSTESFWFAETLKYLYLLFDDTNKLPLDKYVFNTEAHAFPKFDLTDTLKTGWTRKKHEKESNGSDTKKPEVKVDKKHPPEAQKVNEPLEKQVEKLAKQYPKILKD